MEENTAEQRIAAAVAVAVDYGSIDGGHHKQWLIDQMLRALLGSDYAEWRADYDASGDGNGEEMEPWDEGIPP